MDYDPKALLEYNRYTKGTMWIFFGMMLVPALVTGLGYLFQHDHVLVMIEQILLSYMLPCWIMHMFIDKTLWVQAMAKDMDGNKKKRLINAYVLGGFIGGIFAAILIIFSKFVPFGPSSILLQMPYYSAAWREYMYWFGFIVLWVFLLPPAEVIFFFMFQSTAWTGKGTDFLICGCYALMNLFWLLFVIGGVWAIVGLTAASFGFGYLLLLAVKRTSGSQAVGIRMGFAIGVVGLLIFLNLVHPSVERPYYYARGHTGNSFRG